uniref:Uncharacterized protein n=1 Tax=Rhizophora mucronata TaxID=61149 RepID=A0A2P2P1S8_RHIMU
MWFCRNCSIILVYGSRCLPLDLLLLVCNASGMQVVSGFLAVF